MPSTTDGHGAVLRHCLVVEEVLLDRAPLVAETQYETLQAVVPE